MKNSYPNKNERRIKPGEIKKFCQSKYNMAPSEGFANISQCVGHVEGSNRVASYTEFQNIHAWYIHQDKNGYLSWETGEVEKNIKSGKVVFIFAMGMGNGDPLPQPSGCYKLFFNGKHLLSFHTVKHSWTWTGERATFHFNANRIESANPNSAICLDSHIKNESWAAFGPGFLSVPRDMVQPGKSNVIKVVPENRVPSTRWFQIAAVRRIIGWTDIFQGLDHLGNPERAKSNNYNVYFGDIHTHSGYHFNGKGGCGTGTIDQNYKYARDVSGLDIYALTDHEWQLCNEEYARNYFKKADQYLNEGKFVTIPGYEFTNSLWGHRNVYYRNSSGKVIGAHQEFMTDYWDDKDKISPEVLWRKLDELGVDAITIPHHPSATSHPLTWDFYNPKFDRLVEVYSCWGSSEYYGDYPRGVSDRYQGLSVKDALDKNIRLGLLASSDGHDGHPGNAQSPLNKHHHLFHPLGSGWIAVLAPDLTRNNIFDAMYQRRCYATSGVPIVLSFNINGAIMGEEIKVDKNEPVNMNIKVKGCNGLDHIRIINNGEVIKNIPCYGEWNKNINFTHNTTKQRDYYYIRVVQVDNESAWSSPIWVDRK